MAIRVSRVDIEPATDQLELARDMVDGLWRHLEQAVPDGPSFDAVHVLYYAGAMIVILGMVLLAATQWDSLDGIKIAALAGDYAAVFLSAGHWIWSRFERSRTVGGLLVVMAVSMTPVIIYGLQRQYDPWPFGDPSKYRDFHVWIRSGWFAMQVATVAAVALALVFYRFPFLTAPLAFVLRYASMDLTPMFAITRPRAGKNDGSSPSRVVPERNPVHHRAWSDRSVDPRSWHGGRAQSSGARYLGRPDGNGSVEKSEARIIRGRPLAGAIRAPPRKPDGDLSYGFGFR